MSTRRFADEPAFVLHRYDWSESSLVLEVFTRHHGRVALVAKGVKRPTSQYRPVLLPLQPLQITWTGDAEVRTLKAAQWSGGHVMPTGEALIAGGYLNELLMRLLARDDPHPRLFDHFSTAVQLLAERPETQAVVVRAFELLLLRDAGLLPDLASEGQTFAPLDAATAYVLLPEAGLRGAHDDDHHPLPGERWLALQAALDEPAPFVPVMKACAEVAATLRIPLRNLLHYHGGVRVFRTRQLLLDVQAISRHRGSAPTPPNEP
ncbi:MAG: DNA repair protein RecO [Hydrogenophaga sp.]|uniref:DNA repair protein RecO n=1 Tax=Hydrogenophaga intermedia TaxID=65786 RepID=UPI00204406DF|nr:DNA repair protein RecO [Hydrogenophaga intermedia]